LIAANRKKAVPSAVTRRPASGADAQGWISRRSLMAGTGGPLRNFDVPADAGTSGLQVGWPNPQVS